MSTLVDAETLRMAHDLGMNQSVCASCKQPTLFIVNPSKTNIPLTCGQMKCGVKCGEAWAQPKDGLKWHPLA